MSRLRAAWHTYEFELGIAGFSLLAIGLILVASCVFTPPTAHAAVSVDAAGGLTHFLITTPDGDYLQRGLPHALDTRSLAYRVGLCWHFNEQWSTCGAYLNLGTLNQTAKFVSDEDYAAKANACVKNCSTAPTYRMTDAYHGGELTVTRRWITDDYGFFLKGGGALMLHRFTITREDTGQSNHHYGRIPMVVLGTGVSYKWAYLEVDYYHGIGGSNCLNGCDWPLSTEMPVIWAGVHVPIGG